MKIFSKLLFAAGLLAGALVLVAQDAETISVNTTMNVNGTGDAQMTVTTTLTAKQFANWKSQYGDDQGLLKRDMEKDYLGAFDLSDWDVKMDSMNRVVTVAVKVHGVVIPRGNGTFEFRVPKSWRGGERNGTTYNYNFANNIGDGMIEQSNVKLILPATASHFTEDKSETGDTVIQYRLPSGSMAGMLLYAGIAFLLLGGLAIVMAMTVIKPPRSVHA